MRQAIHIFTKDVRALWPQILLVTALTAAAEFTESDKLDMVLVVARWYLIACVVHQEKLVGDRQFWVTRPYGWKSLLAAKALFVGAFVHAPALLSDVAILISQGLPLGPAWGNLWMRQAVLIAAWQYGLPAMALAAVTSGLVSFGLAAAGSLAAMFAVNLWLAPLLTRWGPLFWMLLASGMTVLGVAAAAVVVWQYGRRQAPAARAVLCGAMAVCFALWMSRPSDLAVGIETRLRRAPAEVESIRLRFDNDQTMKTAHGEGQEGTLDLWLRLEGIPEGMRIEPDLVRVAFEARDGSKWDSGWRDTYNVWEWQREPEAKVSLPVPMAALEKARPGEVNVRMALAMTVLGRPQARVASLEDGDVRVEGVGLCGVGKQASGYVVNCRNGAPPEAEISVPVSGYRFTRPMWWPYPVTFDASPVWRTKVGLPKYWNGWPLIFQLRRPVAHLRRDTAIERVRFENGR